MHVSREIGHSSLIQYIQSNDHNLQKSNKKIKKTSRDIAT